MKCSNCNTIIIYNAKFCHNCGKTVTMPSPIRNEQGRWGYVDETGTIVIPYKYHVANAFENGSAFVQPCYDKGMLIDCEGNIIKELDYTRIGDFYDGVALINNGGKYYEGNGHMAGSFCGGLYGYINEMGKEIVPVAYRDATYFKNGYAAIDISQSAESKKQWVFIDKYGNQISEKPYVHIGVDEEFDWREDHGYGYINLYCFEHEIKDYDWGFHHDRARISNGEKWGFIDVNGKEIISPKYDKVRSFEQKYYTTVKASNKWGIIDRLGNLILPISYDEIQLFTIDKYIAYAILKIHGGYGVLRLDFDKITKIVPFEYIGCAIDLDNKRIEAYGNNKSEYFNLEGDRLIQYKP